jgi:hypothetical protein
MTTSEQINEIAGALAKAQGAMRPAVKDATNPAFKRGNKESKYADLAANVEAAREPLAQNGIAVIQEPTTVERGIAVATRLVHSSGQWIQFDPLTVPLAKQDAHGVGSAITYARRYALGAALGIVAEDDDGNAAVTSSEPAKARTQPTRVAPADYEEWLMSLEVVSDEGTDALLATWKASAVDKKTHLQSTNAPKWEAIKKRADAATARVAAKVPA